MATPNRKGVGGRPRGEPTTIVRLPLPVAPIARRLADGTSGPASRRGVRRRGARRDDGAARHVAGACGFLSPAEDYLNRPLDFNELLASNPSAIFADRIAGDSMRDAGISPGDLAIVDRSLSPSNGCVVLARLAASSPSSATV